MDDNNLILHHDDQPIRADARRNRERLLATAQSLFSQEGVDSVSMTAIAETAGVGKGTLYRHFTNKADLCNALLDEDMRALQGNVLTYFREHDEAPPLDKLNWFVAQVFQFVQRNRDLLLAQSDVGGIALDHAAHLWWRQTIVGLLSQVIPREHVAYSADVLYVMLDVRIIRFQQEALGYTDEQILAGLQRTVEQFVL